MKVLITLDYILTQKSLKFGSKIELKINNNVKIIEISNNRFVYKNEEFN